MNNKVIKTPCLGICKYNTQNFCIGCKRTLPILQILSKGTPAKSNQVRTLILTPTRELAAQVNASIEN
jgi:predicted Fe-S protein YdhL (DUF1289 family)